MNALSSHFVVRSHREGKMLHAEFSKGLLISKKEGKTQEENGTYIDFIPDPELFKKFKFQEEFIRKRLWNYAYLNTGLTLFFNGEAIQSEHGLLDLLIAKWLRTGCTNLYITKVKNSNLLSSMPKIRRKLLFLRQRTIHCRRRKHLSAYREGILKGVNEFANKNYQGVDVRDGIVGCILVKIKDPVFESQTKNKLGNSDIRSGIVHEVKEAVIHLLHKNQDVAKQLIERIVFNEKLRKELASVKKEAKEKQKKISYKIPKLRDCKFHYNEESLYSDKTMIFLTEGESASASIVSARDPLLKRSTPCVASP